VHKALVNAERTSYEKTVGTVQSPTHFLQLLTTDPGIINVRADMF